MSNRERPLTATAIKYLLAIAEQENPINGVRGCDVAARLGVTKPSAHRMLGVLREMGLLEKERFHSAFLTEDGCALASQYMVCFHLLYARLEKSLGVLPDECKNAVCAILSETPEAELPALAERLRHTPCANCMCNSKEEP